MFWSEHLTFSRARGLTRIAAGESGFPVMEKYQIATVSSHARSSSRCSEQKLCCKLHFAKRRSQRPRGTTARRTNDVRLARISASLDSVPAYNPKSPFSNVLAGFSQSPSRRLAAPHPCAVTPHVPELLVASINLKTCLDLLHPPLHAPLRYLTPKLPKVKWPRCVFRRHCHSFSLLALPRGFSINPTPRANVYVVRLNPVLNCHLSVG
jgi:hypothetical protein